MFDVINDHFEMIDNKLPERTSTLSAACIIRHAHVNMAYIQYPTIRQTESLELHHLIFHH